MIDAFLFLLSVSAEVIKRIKLKSRRILHREINTIEENEIPTVIEILKLCIQRKWGDMI